MVEYIGAPFQEKEKLPYRYTVELFLVDFSMWCRRDFRESRVLWKSAA